MTKNIKLSSVTLYVSLLAFISFLFYVLLINKEVLYTAHERSEFLYGTSFFYTLMQKPFGLLQYVGAWLTQLFYYPALGAGVLVAIWALIYFVGFKAFRLSGSASSLMILPLACLLTSIVDLGYWIYISTIRGYWFSQSLGYLFLVLLLWAARCTPRKCHIVWYFIGMCSYPVLGWFALLYIICLILVEKPTWRELVGVVLLLFTPGIWRGLLYSGISFNDVMLAGLPQFVTASDITPRLTVPFYVLAAVSVLIALCGRFLSRWFVPVVSVIAGIAFTISFMFSDKNYIDEMRMSRFAEEDNWKGVLAVAEETDSPTSSMIVLRNIALMNEGGLLDRSFKMGNDAKPINPRDSLHVSFLEIAAPIAYYNYGMTNEAIRLNFECGVQGGFCPFYLKMLTRCELAKGEGKLVERYQTHVNYLPFHADWKPAPASAKTKELQTVFADEITGVESSDGYIVNSISLWNDSLSKIASEQALFYSMVRRDSRRFWTSLRTYVKLHMQEQFPLSAQEAYIMYMDKAPEKRKMMLPVEKEVYERYKQFWATLEGYIKSGQSKEATAEKMRGAFGDTYWYYNIFSRRIY